MSSSSSSSNYCVTLSLTYPFITIPEGDTGLIILAYGTAAGESGLWRGTLDKVSGSLSEFECVCQEAVGAHAHILHNMGNGRVFYNAGGNRFLSTEWGRHFKDYSPTWHGGSGPTNGFGKMFNSWNLNNSTAGCIIGDNYKSYDRGINWYGLGMDIITPFGTDDYTGHLFSDNGIYRTTDGGTNWTNKYTLGTIYLCGTRDKYGMMKTGAAEWRYTDDKFETKTICDTPPTMSGSNKVFIAYENSGYYWMSGDGNNVHGWSSDNLDDWSDETDNNIACVHQGSYDGSDDAWAVDLSTGKILQLRNGSVLMAIQACAAPYSIPSSSSSSAKNV